MRTTNALAVSMRKLLAHLHPPSPPTAKESQQLLDVLQKSFRSRLDEQHPHPSQRNTWAKENDQLEIPIHVQSTSSHATNSHLSSILANPILRLADAQHTRQDAISNFDRLTSEQDVDISRVVGLLRQYTKVVAIGDRSQHRERLSDRLNSWLHVTNRSSRERFLLNDAARAAAIDLSMNEHNEAILWTWLRLVYERRLIKADLSSIRWLDVEDHLVSGLMRIAIQQKNNEDAARQFLEACRYRHDSGRGIQPNFAILDQVSSSALARSGKRLASAIVYHRHRHGIDASTFGEVFEYLPRWDTPLVENSAFCAVYHPSKPTANHVYEALRDQAHAQTFVNHLAKARPHHRKISMIVLLDASKLALEQGKKSQASFLISFVGENYPEYLPAGQDEQLRLEIERLPDLVPS